jgi:hypothetical protein
MFPSMAFLFKTGLPIRKRRWLIFVTLIIFTGRVLFNPASGPISMASADVGFVAKLYLRRFVLWSLPVTYRAQRGRATMAISFKGAHFPPEIILMGVRWYVAYPLSYRHVEELLEERGGFCRKFCSGGHEGAVAPVCGGD